MRGKAAGPRPVVCLHGWAMRGALFQGLAARLGPDCAVYAPDLPGHGDAAWQTPGLDSAARRAKDAIEATERDDVLLVGWSMGAAVAWTYLAAHGRARLAGLVTVEMSPKLVNEAGWTHGLLGQEAGRLARTTEEIHADWPRAAEKIATTMFADRVGAVGYGRPKALAQVLSNPPRAMGHYWDEMLEMDLRGVPASVTVPWIVAHGTRSRVYPAAAAHWLAEAAPRARLARFDRSGHSPHLEEPAAFARMIAEFDAALGGDARKAAPADRR